MPEALHLEIRWKKKPVARTGLKRLVRSVLAAEGRPEAEVGLLLADDATLREMNRTWRGKDRATDVLSFPSDDDDFPAGSPRELGDIAISMDRALEQAPRFGATFELEVARLVVHGLLHLLGYDHHSPAEGRRMKARERVHLAGVARGSLVGAGKRAAPASAAKTTSGTRKAAAPRAAAKNASRKTAGATGRRPRSASC